MKTPLILFTFLFIAVELNAQCWKTIAEGNTHSAAIKTDGTLWAWGDNTNYQLGDGTNISKNIPVQIGNDTIWKSISLGYRQSFGLKKDGTIWTWGYGSILFSTNAIPTQVGNDSDWKTIASGYDHFMAIKTDGTLWAWGSNIAGQLGDGMSATIIPNPIKIGTDNNWKSVSGGEEHSLAIKTDGSLWAWGHNSYRQLGDGTATQRNVPTHIGTDADWELVSAGYRHSLAIKTNGTLWGWGSNGDYQIASTAPLFEVTPTQIGTDNNWKLVSCARIHTMAIKNDSTLWGWGNGNYGQLGNGTNSTSQSPIQIGTAKNWQDISAKGFTTLFLNTNQSLLSSGENYYGQVGEGTNVNKNIPTLLSCNVIGIKELEYENIISIFPNPTSCSINIIDENNKYQNSTIEIKDYLGQTIVSTLFIKQLDISSFSAGMYIMTIQSNNNKVLHAKIIKE